MICIGKDSHYHGLICHVTGTMHHQQMLRTTYTNFPWQHSMRQRYVMYVANCCGMYASCIPFEALLHNCFIACTVLLCCQWQPVTFVSFTLLVSFLLVFCMQDSYC